MKIEILVDEFPKLSETFVLADVLQLAGKGHDVTVMCARRVPLKSLLKPEQIEGLSSVKIVQWPDQFWDNKRLLPWRIRQLMKRASIRIVRTILPTPDVRYAHFAWQGMAELERNDASSSVPLVTIYHGRDVSHEYQRNKLADFQDLFKNGSLHLTVNRPFSDLIIASGAPKDRVAVHHLGVPVSNYEFRNPDWSQPVRMISLCRLVEKKGIDVAINALSDLVKRKPDLEWTYDIAGDGPLEKDLKAQVLELGLSDRVHFLGSVPHTEALERIGNAHVLIAPSVTGADGDQEGIPVTLMEAMALGTIVCSTRHSGIPELVEHGASGLLSDEHSVAELSENLQNIIEGGFDREAMAASARAKVETEFEQDSRNDALISRLASVI